MNRGLIYAGILILIWSWVTPFITLLSEDFDVVTQNLYRFSAAGLILLPMALLSDRRRFAETGRSHALKLLFLALLVFLVQTLWVKGIYLTTPTTAVLIGAIDVVSIALFSALLFTAERRIARNKYFLMGSIFAIAGVVGVALGREDASTEFSAGIYLLLVRSLIWATYIVSIRSIMEKEDPLIIATWVFLIASVFFLPAAALWGDMGKIMEVPATTNILLFGSGALCVGIGNALNFAVIKRLGSTISVTLLLVLPFSTGVISYFIFDETVTALQIVSGIAIVSSCCLVAWKAMPRD